MKKFLSRLTAAACVLALCLTPVSALSVEDALALLEEEYVGAIPPAAYEAQTLDELFAAVGDPYTYYLSAEDYKRFTETVESETTVTGIGAAVQFTEEGILLNSILEGSGAMEAGLRRGDCIIAIDGAGCVPAVESQRELIIGEEGTHVTLTVRHADGSVQDYDIVRRTVTVHNTVVKQEGDVCVIDCDSFGSKTAEYIFDGIETYDETTKLWLIDLRSNVGGIANAAVSALGAFTGFGPKLYYLEKGGDSFASYYLTDASSEKPVIVLVDDFSASASEILAGGVRGLGAGIVIGSRTYGKGTAQIVLDKSTRPDLFDEDALKVTVYRFYCADGNTSDKIGVIPTLLIDYEYADAAARLLRTEAPAEGGDYLTFLLNGIPFFVSTAPSEDEERSAALGELLAALPPDVMLIHDKDGEAGAVTPAEALALYGGGAAARGFSDVADSPYATAIDTLAAYRILGGDGAGHFSPQRLLTRAELCEMLAKALNVTSKQTGVFSDVPAESWYNGSVSAMSSLEFVNGVGDGLFAPDAPLTQEQFIAVMGRLASFLNLDAREYTDNLKDDLAQFEELAPFAPWARGGAALLTDFPQSRESAPMLYAGLDEIDPSAPVTREQAAATLCGILKSLGILVY